MKDIVNPKIAIVDIGMGNLFSVKHACMYAGLDALITMDKQKIMSADAVILPGVGAFGDAMDTLRKANLIDVILKVASSSTPLIGICLGMQLLMTESFEFGIHQGLGIVKGSVVRFDNPLDENSGKILKVPHVCWNRIYHSVVKEENNSFENYLLDGLNNGEFMYFVHSYYVKPEDSSVILSISRYGNIEFCSGLHLKNIYAFQFHPERSGPQGLKIYKNLLSILQKTVIGG